MSYYLGHVGAAAAEAARALEQLIQELGAACRSREQTDFGCHLLQWIALCMRATMGLYDTTKLRR